MIVGLTGGMGCGKSTALELFRKEGFRTVESDRIVRDLLEGDAEVRESIRAHFGTGVFGKDGTIDRSALGARVFSDDGHLRWLEGLLHPRVRAAWRAKVAAEPEKDWMVEIPLLFEKKLEKIFDCVISIVASDSVAWERLKSKGLSEETIQARKSRQLSAQEKAQRADFVILNDGSASFLKSQVEMCSQQLRNLPAKKQTIDHE